MVVSHRDDQFELNTLKISSDTKERVRKPYVWEKPSARLYDYHYEIGGLYYQPMIKYIKSRKDGERRAVEIPDRIQSNFDRRAYELKADESELEEFLTESYRRRMKDINSKFVHVENEKIRRSKKSSDLNMIRGAANTRDQYLCKLQLYYTGHAAHRDDEELIDNRRITSESRYDDYYSPGFQRAKRNSLNIEPRISQFLEEKYSQEDRETNQKKFQQHLGNLKVSTGQLLERSSEIKKLTRENCNDEEILPPSTFMIALSDVKKRVDDKKKELEPVKVQASQLKMTYNGVAINEAGSNVKSFLMSEQYKPRAVPDFDLGDDVVIKRID